MNEGARSHSLGETIDQDGRCPHTALQCLVALARHRGVAADVDRLLHDYAVVNQEVDERRLLRMAKDLGLKSDVRRLRWQDLPNLGAAYPFIARLRNGNSVVILGFRSDPEGEDRAVVMDPLASRADFIYLSHGQLEKAWDGRALLVKKDASILEEEQPFGIRWFVPELFRLRSTFGEVALAAVALMGIALVTPIFFQIVIDKVLAHQSYSTLHVLGIGILLALAFDALLGFLRSHLLLYATSKIDIRVATRTFKHLVSLPIHFFEKTSAGVVTKHMQQTGRIREFLTGNLFLTLLEATALLVFVPVLFLYSTELTFVVLLFAGLIATVIMALIGPFRRRITALYRAEGERQSLLVETIHGMPTVKALALEPVQRLSWDQISAETVKNHFRVGKISNIARTLTQFLEKTMTVAIIWLGAYRVFEGDLTVGALVAFNMLAGRVSAPLVQIVSLIHQYQEVTLSVRMLGEIMNAPVEGGSAGSRLRPPIHGEIGFEGVSFQYAPNVPPALDRVDIHIRAGSVVGVVGRSGSGKSTLTRLVQGMYPVHTGLVRVDGYDLRELDLQHLRANIGVVLQENFVFRGSIRENIAATRPNATFEEIVAVARTAGAEEFIQRQPQGYDTLLEENGANLSGGQKQRLAIARALLTDPRILIFDEATSALDPESEAIVQANLARIAANRTMIIVSHRLASLQHSDQILVLDQGRVVGSGRHQELLQRCSVYRELWNRQRRTDD